MSPARRITVMHCIRQGVLGAVVTCVACRRRRWMGWAEMRVNVTEDLEMLPFRNRLRCRRCGSEAFWFKASSKPQ
jgi:hypothetical protein